MKRFLIIVTALAITLSLASCGSKPAAPEPSATPAPAAAPETEPKPTPEPDPMLENPVSTAVNKLIDDRTITIEKLDSASSEAPGEVQFGLFSIAMADYFLYPLLFVDDVAKGDGEAVGYPDATAEVKWTGFEYEFVMDCIEDGKDLHIEGRYDYKTDSMTANYTSDGTTGAYLEYVKNDGGGYMSQISVISDDNPDAFNVMSLYSSGEDAVCGVKTVPKDDLPETVYRKVPADPASFIKNDEFFLTYTGGKGYVVFEGQAIEF